MISRIVEVVSSVTMISKIHKSIKSITVVYFFQNLLLSFGKKLETWHRTERYDKENS